MKQKITLLLLCLAMVLSLCTVLSFGGFAEESAEVWDGSVATAYAGGNGTPEHPYQIANGAQLAYMAQQVNAGENASASFLLTKDVNLANIAWTPIGISLEMPFSGSFDGDGKTISGLAIETSDAALYAVGLFGVLTNADVKNLTLTSGFVKAQYNVGALAGYAEGSVISGVTNTGVNVKAQTTTASKSYMACAGGIVGALKAGTSVSDCHIGATVTVTAGNNNANSSYIMLARAGGIVGDASGVKDDCASIFYCSSAATVQSYQSHTNQYQRIGGIVGSLMHANVSGCYSTATVKANAKGYAHAGGIVGNAEVGTVTSNISKATVMTNTVVEGGAQTYNQAHANGGIVGYAGHGSISPAAVIKNNLSMATQIIGKDTDAVARVCTKFTGGGRNNASYNYYTAYEINGVAVLGFTTFYNSDEVKNGNFAVTEAQLKGTATENIDTVNSKPKYSNTPSLVDALNAYVKDMGVYSVTFCQGENGPEFYGFLTDLYDVSVGDIENGTAAVITEKSANFPGDTDMGYMEGDVIVLSVTPAQDYKVLRVEYTYGEVTANARANADGTFSFTMPAADVVVTAYFMEKPTTPYNVVFIDKDGAELETQTVAPDANPVAPEAPAVFGYAFLGWTDVATGEIVDVITVCEAATLQATYEYIGIFTVTFVDKDGAVLSEQTLEKGTTATAPEAPSVVAYNFVGWTDVATGEIVDIATINDTVTLKATYEAIYYTVTFVDKDGVTIKTETVAYGQGATAPTPTSFESYEFLGWDSAFDAVYANITVKALYEYTGTYFGGGYGTLEEPFLLETKEQLLDMVARIAEDVDGTFINGYYELMADIDLEGINWTPIASFTGFFDGNGHTIFNLTNNTSNGDIAFFEKASGTIKDLTFKNASIPNATWQGSHAILVAHVTDMLKIENVHILDAKLGGCAVGFFIANTNGKEVIIKDSTVTGTITGAHQNGNVGGFISLAAKSALTFENCVAMVSTKSAINSSAIGGFVGSGYESTQIFTNCISIVDFDKSSGGKNAPIGAFYGSAGAAIKATFTGCTAYVDIRSEAASAVGGFVGSLNSHNGPTLTLENCATYGTLYSATGTAGSVVGIVSGNHKPKVYMTNVVAIAVPTCGEGYAAGSLIGTMSFGNQGSNHTIVGAYVLTDNVFGEDTSGCTTAVDYTVLDSTTTLPEGLSPDVWTVGALPVISGVSISFDDSVAFNVYAKYGIVLKAHAADKLYVDGKVVAFANQVTLFGESYAKFTFDGIKMADIETKYALSLIGGIAQAEYSMFEYIVNSYAGADEVLKDVLAALLCYGNAAQANPTAVANAIVAIPELETIVADYVEANYANVTLTPVQSEGLKVGFNLYGFVQPVFKVADSVTKVTVTVNGITSELTLVDGYAFYYDLSMLQINETMTVTLYEGDSVALTANYAVANYITEGIAGDTLTDAEKNLCKALAVFVDAVAAYVNN